MFDHVAIIMDGNGRWANSRGHSRVWGHIRGARVVSKIVEESSLLNIKALTLYTFSTENWARPKNEVLTLFKIFKKFLIFEKKNLIKNRVKFNVIGDYSHLPQDTIDLIDAIKEETQLLDGLKLNIAFGYGGRQEILESVNNFIANNPGKLITSQNLENNLFTKESGDVDLLIRTGGDQRISNFLLYQIAYAEIYFTKTKWPNFTTKEFNEIINSVITRERRFGCVESCENLKTSTIKASKNQKDVLNNIG